MKNYLEELIWEECEEAKNFIEIPAIYKHFKEEKDGEDMIYAVSNVSVPLEFNEFKKLYSNADSMCHYFNHTELEKEIRVLRVKDRYYHNASVEKEKLVIYTGLYRDRITYVRPLKMFLSLVDKVKHPNAKQKFRLERVL